MGAIDILFRDGVRAYVRHFSRNWRLSKRHMKSSSSGIDLASLCGTERTETSHSDLLLNSVAEHIIENRLSSCLLLDEINFKRIVPKLSETTHEIRSLSEARKDFRSRAAVRCGDQFMFWSFWTSQHRCKVIEVHGSVRDGPLRVQLLSPLRWRICQVLRFFKGWRRTSNAE